MNKRLLIIIGVLILMFNFGGCRLKELLMNEYEKTERECRKIAEILDHKDEDALKGLLTERTLTETEDLDKGIEFMMSEYQGTSTKIERVSYSSLSNYDKGKHSREIDTYYKIYTDKETYMIYFNYWQTNTIEPDMEGIYSMGMVPVNEEDTNDSYDQKRIGIYYPGWLED